MSSAVDKAVDNASAQALFRLAFVMQHLGLLRNHVSSAMNSIEKQVFDTLTNANITQFDNINQIYNDFFKTVVDRQGNQAVLAKADLLNLLKSGMQKGFVLSRLVGVGGNGSETLLSRERETLNHGFESMHSVSFVSLVNEIKSRNVMFAKTSAELVITRASFMHELTKEVLQNVREFRKEVPAEHINKKAILSQKLQTWWAQTVKTNPNHAAVRRTAKAYVCAEQAYALGLLSIGVVYQPATTPTAAREQFRQAYAGMNGQQAFDAYVKNMGRLDRALRVLRSLLKEAVQPTIEPTGSAITALDRVVLIRTPKVSELRLADLKVELYRAFRASGFDPFPSSTASPAGGSAPNVVQGVRVVPGVAGVPGSAAPGTSQSTSNGALPQRAWRWLQRMIPSSYSASPVVAAPMAQSANGTNDVSANTNMLSNTYEQWLATCCETIVDTVGKTFMFCVPDSASQRRRMIPSNHIYADRKGGFTTLESTDESLVREWISSVMADDRVSLRTLRGETQQNMCKGHVEKLLDEKFKHISDDESKQVIERTICENDNCLSDEYDKIRNNHRDEREIANKLGEVLLNKDHACPAGSATIDDLRKTLCRARIDHLCGNTGVYCDFNDGNQYIKRRNLAINNATIRDQILDISTDEMNTQPIQARQRVMKVLDEATSLDPLTSGLGVTFQEYYKMSIKMEHLLLLFYEAIAPATGNATGNHKQRLVTMLGLTTDGLKLLRERLTDKQKEMPAWSVYQLHRLLQSPSNERTFDPNVKRHVRTIVSHINALNELIRQQLLYPIVPPQPKDICRVTGNIVKEYLSANDGENTRPKKKPAAFDITFLLHQTSYSIVIDALDDAVSQSIFDGNSETDLQSLTGLCYIIAVRRAYVMIWKPLEEKQLAPDVFKALKSYYEFHDDGPVEASWWKEGIEQLMNNIARFAEADKQQPFFRFDSDALPYVIDALKKVKSVEHAVQLPFMYGFRGNKTSQEIIEKLAGNQTDRLTAEFQTMNGNDSPDLGVFIPPLRDTLNVRFNHKDGFISTIGILIRCAFADEDMTKTIHEELNRIKDFDTLYLLLLCCLRLFPLQHLKTILNRLKDIVDDMKPSDDEWTASYTVYSSAAQSPPQKVQVPRDKTFEQFIGDNNLPILRFCERMQTTASTTWMESFDHRAKILLEKRGVSTLLMVAIGALSGSVVAGQAVVPPPPPLASVMNAISTVTSSLGGAGTGAAVATAVSALKNYFSTPPDAAPDVNASISELLVSLGLIAIPAAVINTNQRSMRKAIDENDHWTINQIYTKIIRIESNDNRYDMVPARVITHLQTLINAVYVSMYTKTPPRLRVNIRATTDDDLIQGIQSQSGGSFNSTELKNSVLISLKAMWYARWVVGIAPDILCDATERVEPLTERLFCVARMLACAKTGVRSDPVFPFVSIQRDNVERDSHKLFDPKQPDVTDNTESTPLMNIEIES